jgi:hypothetical protein
MGCSGERSRDLNSITAEREEWGYPLDRDVLTHPTWPARSPTRMAHRGRPSYRGKVASYIAIILGTVTAGLLQGLGKRPGSADF